MQLATAHHAAIVSADSRQVYRRFDIGTAKPDEKARRAVPHFGIDVAEPSERYSASRWAENAERWIGDAEQRGFDTLIVGGTGFYLRALFEPLFQEPPLDAPRRAAMQREMSAMPISELRRWCTALDPERAELGRAQLLRAIEVALLTGTRLSELHRRQARAPRYAARYLVVDPGPALAGRIAERARTMMRNGWEDEVRGLVEIVPGDAPAWNATGYGTVRRMVAGEMTRDAALERITIDTRQYAKRQRTWFRHQLQDADVTRVNPDEPRRDDIVEAWWEGEGS
jgi:tRNA dimethylallyltransferase